MSTVLLYVVLKVCTLMGCHCDLSPHKVHRITQLSVANEGDKYGEPSPMQMVSVMPQGDIPHGRVCCFMELTMSKRHPLVQMYIAHHRSGLLFKLALAIGRPAPSAVASLRTRGTPAQILNYTAISPNS